MSRSTRGSGHVEVAKQGPTPPPLADTAAVVICAYTEERWSDLIAGYEALWRQTREPDEVVIVVDHNTALLSRARDVLERATVITNTGDRGLSGARNTGIAACRSDVVLFLDDDARPDEQWVERSCAPMQDSTVVGVSGWASADWDAPGRPSWFPEAFLWVVGCSYEGLPHQRAEVRNPIGCTMGFRRHALLAAQGFTSGIGRVGKHPVGCEETELSIRIRSQEAGSRIIHEPSAVVHHRVTAARRTLAYFVRRCFWEGYSKAVVASTVGTQDALESERVYATRTLPVAVLRGLTSLLRRGDTAAARQSAAVVLGLGTTAFGYAYGRARGLRPPPRGAVVTVGHSVG
ncbi:glycosyltransferase [Kineococcus vitellinus]|uniref:glycosyltransferase n=1 Tax=Kineococcus vitellinus TaxID=2696565 RepID=UPI00196B1B71